MRWYWRIPAKALVFGLVVLAVEFPYPSVLIKQIGHYRNMNAMIDPNAPELAAFEDEFLRYYEKQRRASSRPASMPAVKAAVASSRPRPGPSYDVQRAVERFVYEKVHYDWDWNIWGVADYMPTVSEMFARAKEYKDGQIREDCDGRAVMAASLLKRLGYETQIVTDIRHVWVQILDGDRRPIELMGPGREKTMIASSQGNRVMWGTVLNNAAVGLSFGIAVFPWEREAIVFVTLMALLWYRGTPMRTTLIGVLMAFAGWHFLRNGIVSIGEASQPGYTWAESPLNAWLGFGYTVLGCGMLLVGSWRARRAERHPPTTKNDPIARVNA